MLQDRFITSGDYFHDKWVPGGLLKSVGSFFFVA